MDAMSSPALSLLPNSGAPPPRAAAVQAQQNHSIIGGAWNVASSPSSRLGLLADVSTFGNYAAQSPFRPGHKFMLGLQGRRRAHNWAPRLSGNTESIAFSEEAVSSTNADLSTTDSLGFTEESVTEVESSPNGATKDAFPEDDSRRESDPRSEEAGPTVEEAKVAAGMYSNTKTVPLKKGKGYVVADLLMVYGGVLDRPFGSGQMIAAAGDAVIERVIEEFENPDIQTGVDEKLLSDFRTSIGSLLKGLEVVSAAQERSKLLESLEVVKLHCRQAILVANKF